MLANPAVPVKKMPLWLKLLIGAGALIGLGMMGYVVFIFWALYALGSAGTQYNTIVTNEAARIQPTLLVTGCTQTSGGEESIGNLDAIEKYRFHYACNPAPAGLDQQVGSKLASLGYTKYGGWDGIYRNKCCEMQYQAAPDGYTIGLYSNQVNGRY